MKENLIQNIENILKELGVLSPKVSLDYPTHFSKGDLSTNVAMIYAKELGKSPMIIAEEIKSKLDFLNAKIEVALPGFINFFFSSEYFAESIKDTSIKNIFSGKKYFIEHTQPNPFKTFHIGHLMNNAIGESIQRIVRANGGEVKVATYHGDKGLHVAKAVWAMRKGVALKEAYAFGHKMYEDDETAKAEIVEINKKIYDESDAEINKLYEEGRQESLEEFEYLYRKLGSEFDFHFYESEAGEVGKGLVLENVGEIFSKGENNSIIFKGEDFEPKTHTRVFLNSEGLPTYEAKEVGLAQIKKDWFDYDTSVTITANEQDSFFKVVEVAIGEIFPELKGKLKHLSHGMLKLPSGKMSSRTGTIISAEQMIDDVKAKVLEKMKEGEWSPKDKEDIAEVVAISAIKYSILRQAIGGDIIFDFDKSISFEGDSGPYLQYSTVRANSILKKAEGVVPVSFSLPTNWQTTNLERMLERFSSVVKKSGEEYAPHHIATYLIELSSAFNAFYAEHKIVDENDATSPYKLAITKSFAEVMAQGLNLLGIKVPERM